MPRLSAASGFDFPPPNRSDESAAAPPSFTTSLGLSTPGSICSSAVGPSPRSSNCVLYLSRAWTLLDQFFESSTRFGNSALQLRICPVPVPDEFSIGKRRRVGLPGGFVCRAERQGCERNKHRMQQESVAQAGDTLLPRFGPRRQCQRELESKEAAVF